MHVAFEQQYLADVVAVGITSSRTGRRSQMRITGKWNETIGSQASELRQALLAFGCKL